MKTPLLLHLTKKNLYLTDFKTKWENYKSNTITVHVIVLEKNSNPYTCITKNPPPPPHTHTHTHTLTYSTTPLCEANSPLDFYNRQLSFYLRKSETQCICLWLPSLPYWVFHPYSQSLYNECATYADVITKIIFWLCASKVRLDALLQKWAE